MDLKELIKKFKISYVYLAGQMGMPQSTFNNKIGANLTYKFSPEEEGELKTILFRMTSGVLKELFPEGFKLEYKPQELNDIKIKEFSLLPDGTFGMGFEYSNDLKGIGNNISAKLNELRNIKYNPNERKPGEDS